MISILPSSTPFSFMFIFAYVAVWLEVSLALVTFLEVLSVVIYDLSHPNLLPWCLGFFIELVALSSTFIVFSPALVVVFQVLRYSFFKDRSTFFRGSLASMRHFTAITSVPASRRH